MEPIIEFLEQYWGYTLFGGITVGTIVAFVVVMIRFLLKNKHVNGLINGLIKKAEDLTSEAKHERERAAQVEEERLYMQRVTLATFEAISYLVVSSKLPIEEKIALQKKFQDVVVIEETKEEEVIEEKPVIEVVKETVAKSKSILDSFMEE